MLYKLFCVFVAYGSVELDELFGYDELLLVADAHIEAEGGVLSCYSNSSERIRLAC